MINLYTLILHIDELYFRILKVIFGFIVVSILLFLSKVYIIKLNKIHTTRVASMNFTIFCISIFTVIEFFYPNNSALGWIALSVAASILTISNDYIVKPSIIYFMIILSTIYALIGLNILYH